MYKSNFKAGRAFGISSHAFPPEYILYIPIANTYGCTKMGNMRKLKMEKMALKFAEVYSLHFGKTFQVLVDSCFVITHLSLMV